MAGDAVPGAPAAVRASACGGDFTIYWTSGRNLRQGTSPYVPVVGRLGFVYPPFALLPFAVLSLLPLVAAYVVWLGVGASCLAAMVTLAVRRGMSLPLAGVVLAAITLDGFTNRTAWLGQLGLLLLGLVVVDVVAVRDRRGAGILTGVAIAMKFTPATMLLWYLARRQWWAAATACVTFAATIALGFAVAPHIAAHYWTDLLVHHRLGTGVPTWYGNENNQSLANAVMMLTGSVTPGHLLLGKVISWVAALAALVAGARAARLDRAWLSIGLLGLASCLVTTSTWDHHYLWFLALIVAAATRELRQAPAALLVLAVWLVWSYTLRWPHMMYHHLGHMTRWELTQSVATPILAGLFSLACCAHLAPTQTKGSNRTTPA